MGPISGPPGPAQAWPWVNTLECLWRECRTDAMCSGCNAGGCRVARLGLHPSILTITEPSLSHSFRGHMLLCEMPCLCPHGPALHPPRQEVEGFPTGPVDAEGRHTLGTRRLHPEKGVKITLVRCPPPPGQEETGTIPSPCSQACPQLKCKAAHG